MFLGFIFASRKKVPKKPGKSRDVSAGYAHMRSRYNVRRPRHTGIGVVEGRLRILDWTRWMDFAPRAMDQDVANGVVDAEEILAHLFRTALPAHRWPPDDESPLRPQWDHLAPVLAQALGLPPPPDKRYGHLRLIEGEKA